MRDAIEYRRVSLLSRLLAMIAMALLVIPAQGFAQLGRPQFRTMPKLTQTDVAMIRKLVREDLASKSTGTTLPWNNPESSNSGTVTLVDRFASSGRDCLRVKYVITPGIKATASERQNTYLLNNCRNADGTWHIDSGARPDTAR